MELSLNIFSLVLSLILLLFGYKLKKIAFAIAWFVVGYSLAQRVLPYINPYFPADFDPFLISLIPVCAGLLLAIFGGLVEKLCIFLIAIAITYLSYLYLVENSVLQFSTFGLGLCLPIGAFLGSLMVALKKPAIMLITAYIGAQYFTNLAISFFGLSGNYLLGLIAMALITLFGFFFQRKNARHSS